MICPSGSVAELMSKEDASGPAQRVGEWIGRLRSGSIAVTGLPTLITTVINGSCRQRRRVLGAIVLSASLVFMVYCKPSVIGVLVIEHRRSGSWCPPPRQRVVAGAVFSAAVSLRGGVHRRSARQGISHVAVRVAVAVARRPACTCPTWRLTMSSSSAANGCH